MQFIDNGPDIPDALLQAHEEGRVVFFCGAGISCAAGLPSFKGLVEKIYKQIGTTCTEEEKAAFDQGRFDITLSLLEQRLPGDGRLDMRRKLAQSLKPQLRRKGATDTHAELLRLARSRDGALRLVTTNFDRVFHKAARRTKQKFHEYTAPMLPIPKNSRWNGLVYLHGMLPAKPDDTDLNRLVVTSGDFGLAYLTERWAARFVSELFRNYVVCFVGYSINDPVLRYMMDALAADRMLGEVTPQAWALGDCELEQECRKTTEKEAQERERKAQERRKTIEWEAKGVTPILYDVPAGSHNHSALHQTLHYWADTYCDDGELGKERIVVSYAQARPSASTQQDDFVGRMLWALSDQSGLPAKRFADFTPVPSLDWLLEAFVSKDRHFEYSDSLKCLAFGGSSDPLDSNDVMGPLARWLLHHLGDPRLILWVVECGGQLHKGWTWMIECELDRFASLECDGKTAELEEIRSQAPKAIPGPLMRTLWRLLLSGRVKSPGLDLYRWEDRLKRDGLTATLRLELRELLAPKVVVEKPFRWGDKAENTNEPAPNYKLELASEKTRDHLYGDGEESLCRLNKTQLSELLEDFEQLLRDALDLNRELRKADGKNNVCWESHQELPSITPHWQNRGFHDWVTLIELLRDAWLAVHGDDSARATRIAQAWFERPYYATFKRLALFAASQDACIAPEQWVDWLLADGAWCLWSVETQREVCRLLVGQGGQLTGAFQDRLETAICKGPELWHWRPSLWHLGPWPWLDLDDPEPNDGNDEGAFPVWQRLAKLKLSGLALGASAQERLDKLSSDHPQWQLEANERDEFSHWMSGTGDPDFEERRKIDVAPRKRRDLVQWLLNRPSPENRPFHEDTWRDVCRKYPLNALFALADLAKQGNWLSERWCDALYAWSDKKQIQRLWCCTAPVLETMPDTVIQEIAHGVTWWIKAASLSISRHEDILLQLCRRVLAMHKDKSTDLPATTDINAAINHPVGHITQALINRCLNNNDRLPSGIKPFFIDLCDVQVAHFRYGRVLLAERLLPLFSVDRPWTEQYLLPLFSWSNPDEAKAVWGGFLRSLRLYQPLLKAFKSDFLETVKHYDELGDDYCKRQFVVLLTHAALERTEGYTEEEFRDAIGELPQDGIEKSAWALWQALDSTEQREEYWKNRVQPFWQQIWPKSDSLVTPQVAEYLACLIIAARKEFPAALDELQDWLSQSVANPSIIVRKLGKSDLCREFPEEALRLLNKIIADKSDKSDKSDLLQNYVAPQDLKQCLDKISDAWPRSKRPKLECDPQYQRLHKYWRQQDSQ